MLNANRDSFTKGEPDLYMFTPLRFMDKFQNGLFLLLK